MSKNLLSENMLRFGTKNLSEGAKRRLVLESVMETIKQHGLKEEVTAELMKEEYPYDELKSNPTNEVIASVLYKAKQTMDDKEAWVVAALQAIKPGQASISAVSQALAKINGGKQINQWIASFMNGHELTDTIHNGTSVFGQLARIYTNGASTFASDVPPTVVALYDVDESFKDTLKKFNFKHDSYQNKSIAKQYTKS